MGPRRSCIAWCQRRLAASSAPSGLSLQLANTQSRYISGAFASSLAPHGHGGSALLLGSCALICGFGRRTTNGSTASLITRQRSEPPPESVHRDALLRTTPSPRNAAACCMCFFFGLRRCETTRRPAARSPRCSNRFALSVRLSLSLSLGLRWSLSSKLKHLHDAPLPSPVTVAGLQMYRRKRSPRACHVAAPLLRLHLITGAPGRRCCASSLAPGAGAAASTPAVNSRSWPGSACMHHD